MAKEEFIVRGVSEKTSKKTDEPFWVIETDDDEFTCFDVKLKDELLKHLDFLVVVEVQRKGQYKNVRDFIEAKEKQKPATGVSRGEEERIASMLTSYVKDLIVAQITQGNEIKVDDLTGYVMSAYKNIKSKLGETVPEKKETNDN